MAANYIAQNEDPTTVCYDLGYCASPKTPKPNKQTTYKLALAMLKTVPNFLAPKPTPKPIPPKDEDLCSTCTTEN